MTDPYQWIFRVPPTVSNYEECFHSMVENQAFEEYLVANGDENAAADWEGFDSDATWEFFASAEEDYDCAGIC